MRFGWSVIAGGRGEEWDGVNSRRENSVKEISSGETERMESTVSKRKMRENGKRGKRGQLELSVWGQTWLEGSDFEMRETGVTVSVCLCFPSFFSPLFLIFIISFYLCFCSLPFFLSKLILKSSSLTSISFIPSSAVLTTPHRLSHSFPNIYSLISPPVLSIYQSLCLSAHVWAHFAWITQLIFPAHPKLHWLPCFPPSLSPVHLNVTN